MSEFEQLNKQLAASQAKEKQYLEVLERIDGWLEIRNLGGLMPQEKMLLKPSDTSALEAAIAKAGEIIKDRVEKMVRDCMFKIGRTSPYRDLVHELLEEIRAMPGITMEDLP